MHHDDDGDIGRLLRAAGARPQPDEQATAAIRAAVEAEWRAVVAGRQRRRRVAGWAGATAAAAAAGAVAIGWWLSGGPEAPPPATFATVAQLQGTVEWRAANDPDWSPLAEGAVLHAGDRLRTGATGRMALEAADGPALRLDRDTQLDLSDPTRVALARGALYVDSRDRARALVVETPRGEVTHLGTRYQLRLDGGDLRVAVRDGRVQVAATRGRQSVGGGEMLRVPVAGEPERAALAPYGDDWAWVEAVAPTPSLDGLSLDALLGWVAHETGRRIRYETDGAARAAQATMLHGSIAGLAPLQALEAVVATTRLDYRIIADQIVLSDAGTAP